MALGSAGLQIPRGIAPGLRVYNAVLTRQSKKAALAPPSEILEIVRSVGARSALPASGRI